MPHAEACRQVLRVVSRNGCTVFRNSSLNSDASGWMQRDQVESRVSVRIPVSSVLCSKKMQPVGVESPEHRAVRPRPSRSH